MILGLDSTTLATGLFIFCLRIVDVSLGTIRTISTVNGRIKTVFFLGIIEVSVWLAVISSVVNQVKDKPILGVFYAFGFAAGNVLGIILEHRMPMGHAILQVISPQYGTQIADTLRRSGFGATVFQGQGMCGSVTMLHIVCARKHLNEVLNAVWQIDKSAFYTVEYADSVRKPISQCASRKSILHEIFHRK